MQRQAIPAIGPDQLTQSIPDDAPTPLSAVVFLLLTAMLFTALDSAAKYLVLQGMAAPFVAWVRFAVHTVLALVFLQVWRRPALFRPKNLPMQFVRGACLFGSTFFNFLALRELQLAQTISIFFAGPMLITALAGPLLGEWAGWRRWLAIIIGFIGVLVVTRPGTESFKPEILLMICAMLSYSFYVLLTRKMGKTETAESLIFYSALAPSLLMLPVALPLAQMPPTALSWVLLLSLGVFGGLGHWFVILAYKRATTAALAPYPYSQMIWMVLSGWLFFGQLPDGYTVLGAAIIIGSGLYIAWREHVLRKAVSVGAQRL